MSDNMTRLVRLFRQMEDDLGDREDRFILAAAFVLVCLWIAGVVLQWW